MAAKAAAEELSCDVAIANVTLREDWERVLQQVLDKHGQLDIVVNNAGATYVNKPTIDGSTRTSTS